LNSRCWRLISDIDTLVPERSNRSGRTPGGRSARPNRGHAVLGERPVAGGARGRILPQVVYSSDVGRAAIATFAVSERVSFGAKHGAREAGRDPGEIDLWWWPDVNVGASYAEAVEEIKTSLAMAGNHLTRFTAEGKHVPPELLPKLATLAERYVFGEHARPGSANCHLITELGLVDYLADRFAIVGTPADCVKKLERAIEAGAQQFWMSIHFDDKFGLLRDFAEQVIPAFR
jgi:alkanesulfonate monooxygenase SsuD/methylene tetrahydromethanopterin reductase-like flavin-dependent oxidoreductase (luciferase family)